MLRAPLVPKVGPLVVSAVAASLLIAAPAEAAPVAGRLSGTTTATGTATASSGAKAGYGENTSVYSNKMTFTPACSTGPCDTGLVRVTTDGQTSANYSLTWNGTSYTGENPGDAFPPDDCTSRRDGSVLQAGGYRTTSSRISILPTSTDAATGDVTAFTAVHDVRIEATPEAIARGCDAVGEQTITLKGTLPVSSQPPAPEPPPVEPPAPAPEAIRGASSIGFIGTPPYQPAVGMSCTSGFAMKSGDQTWMSGARHCIQERSPVDVFLVEQGKTTTQLASAIRCTGGQLLGCRPSSGYRAPQDFNNPKNPPIPRSDYIAWLPSPGYRAVAEINTGKGVQPVLGRAVPLIGDTVCHFGAASGKERCGKLDVYTRNGYYGIKTSAVEGDSGGAVYVYVKKNGKVVGVRAVGLSMTDWYLKDGKAVSGLGVEPISVVEVGLRLQLLTR